MADSRYFEKYSNGDISATAYMVDRDMLIVQQGSTSRDGISTNQRSSS